MRDSGVRAGAVWFGCCTGVGARTAAIAASLRRTCSPRLALVAPVMQTLGSPLMLHVRPSQARILRHPIGHGQHAAEVGRRDALPCIHRL